MKFHPLISNVFRKIRREKIITLFFSMMMLFFKFALLIDIQKTVDSLSHANWSTISFYLTCSLVLLFCCFGFNCVVQYYFRKLQYTSHYMLITELFGRVLSKNCSYHESYVPSLTLSMIKDDSKFISDWQSIGVITLSGNIAALAGSLLIMLYYNFKITLFVIGALVACFILTYRISKRIGEKTYDLQMSYSKMNQRIIDTLNGIKEVKQYRKESMFQNKLADFIDRDTYRHSKTISGYNAAFTSLYAMLTTALPILVIILGLILIKDGQYTMGELIATYALVGNLQEPVMVIPEFFNQRRQALEMQKKLMPVLEEKKEVYSEEKTGAFTSFDFDSKGYAYQTGKTILQNVKFHLNAGNHIVLKGESGRGKTSLLNLISRFSECGGQEVSMTYNGKRIESIAPDTYYMHVLQLLQTPYIFNDTIRNNITLGDSCPAELLQEVIRVAGLTELLEAKGEDAILESNGENISGGQRQRIGIARSILRKPDILMLDEPISALDQELARETTKRIIAYCEKNHISLIVVSHNTYFEECLQEQAVGNVQVIDVGTHS